MVLFLNQNCNFQAMNLFLIFLKKLDCFGILSLENPLNSLTFKKVDSIEKHRGNRFFFCFCFMGRTKSNKHKKTEIFFFGPEKTKNKNGFLTVCLSDQVNLIIESGFSSFFSLKKSVCFRKTCQFHRKQNFSFRFILRN